jgi:Manganese containing catalase
MVEAVLGGINLRHVLSTGLAATPENGNSVPFNLSHIYASGNIAADMLANVTAAASGRVLATRLYNMTDDPGMKDFLSFLIARDTMHQQQWLAVIEELGGLEKSLPIPNSFSAGEGGDRVLLCLPRHHEGRHRRRGAASPTGCPSTDRAPSPRPSPRRTDRSLRSARPARTAARSSNRSASQSLPAPESRPSVSVEFESVAAPGVTPEQKADRPKAARPPPVAAPHAVQSQARAPPRRAGCSVLRARENTAEKDRQVVACAAGYANDSPGRLPISSIT